MTPAETLDKLERLRKSWSDATDSISIHYHREAYLDNLLAVDSQLIADSRALAAVTKERDWFALLARARNAGVTEWARSSIYVTKSPLFEEKGLPAMKLWDFDPHGLPIETPELRAALEKAINP